MEEEIPESDIQPPQIFGGARKGAKEFQEDSFFFAASPNNRVVFGCIYDGHGGQNGWVASNTARDVTAAFFAQYRASCEAWTVDEWREQLLKLFAAMHDAIRVKFVESSNESSGKRFVDEKGIVRMPNGEPVHGGTTASVVLQVQTGPHSHVVITANVGDSTALLLPRRPSPLGKKSFSFLTVDHGPESQDEWWRVQQLPVQEFPHKLLFVYDKANVFRKYDCPLVFLQDGTKDQVFVANPWGNGLHPTNVRYEPAVYAVTPRTVSKDSTCIAMTRALGDFYAQQFGLSAEPYIGVTKLEDGVEYTIVVGSDGVWDCWKWEEFMQFFNDCLNKDNSIHQAGSLVLAESIDRAISNFGARHFDDASLVAWCRLRSPDFASPSPSPLVSPSASPNTSTLDLGAMVNPGPNSSNGNGVVLENANSSGFVAKPKTGARKRRSEVKKKGKK